MPNTTRFNESTYTPSFGGCKRGGRRAGTGVKLNNHQQQDGRRPN